MQKDLDHDTCGIGMTHSKMKWANRQRLQYIEWMAYYRGLITRRDLVDTFSISDVAAGKDLSLYRKIAPDNLIYKHKQFGFVPSAHFNAVFASLLPELALLMLGSALLPVASPLMPRGLLNIAAEHIILPGQQLDRTVLSQITRAIYNKKKLMIRYRASTNTGDGDSQIIEPHALVDIGPQWLVRAYSEEIYDFCDFALFRFDSASGLRSAAESNAQYDDHWVEMVTIKLAPHPRLDAATRAHLYLNLGAAEELITIRIRGALIRYLLQHLSIIAGANYSSDPAQNPLIVVNWDEIEPYI